MNLVIITALAAVCGAAKLDRTYLPPSSADNAGGSPGSLQAPLTKGSVQGLETPRLPTGSYTNTFGGVVVDAASPGTRASADADQSNLGGLRQSYGSTNSKVGDAAFRGNAGFRDTSFGTNKQANTGQFSHSQLNNNNQFSSGQNNNGQYSNGEASSQSFENKSERPQAAKDRNSNILALSNDVNSEAYSYGFETDNGIAVGENGVAVNGVQAEGGYSYQGDDGQVYKVTYTADEGGYKPQGAHLPTPPPIPEEILKSLEQNARDEAAGLIDDGSYDAQKYNTEGDYTNDNAGNIQHNGGQLSQFAKRPESDATGSGALINQNEQALSKPGSGHPSSVIQNSNFDFNAQTSQLNGASGSGGIAASQNSNYAFNKQSSQADGNAAFGHFGSQTAFNAQPSPINKPGQFGFAGTQFNGQLHQANSQFPQVQNTEASFTGQMSQADGNKLSPNPASAHGDSSQSNSGHQFMNQLTFGQSTGDQVSTFNQGQSAFGSQSQFASQASASAQVENSSLKSQQNQQRFNNQLGSNPSTPTLNQESGISQVQPQFGSSFKPQGSEAFSGASLDREQDNQDFGKPSPQTFTGQNFNRPSVGNRYSNIPTGQVQANKFGSNNLNRFPKPSSQFGNKNEYIPPNFGQKQTEMLEGSNIPNFNVAQSSSGSLTAGFRPDSQKPEENKQIPNFISQNRQNPSVASASATTSFGQTTFQAQPAKSLNSYNSQITQSKPNQFFQQATNFAQQNQYSIQKPIQLNVNPQQSVTFSQTVQDQLSFGTKPTSIPDIELTTPLEPNERPAYSHGSQISSQTSSSFNAFNSKPANNNQAQAPSGFKGNIAIGQTLSPSFPTSSLETTQTETSSPFQSSETKQPDNTYENPQFSQNSFGQNQPSFNQAVDKSYYYKQPSKPFGLTANRPEAPRFPSSPSFQPSGIASESFNQQNSVKLSGSQSLASIVPTAASQFAKQQNYNAITQAAISPFPSPAPNPSQLNSAQNNQFGSRPTFNQQSFGNQAQSLKPALNQQNTFGHQFQASGSQQNKPTFSQVRQPGVPFQSVSKFGQQPSSSVFQTQNQFGQLEQLEQSQNKQEPSDQSSEEKPSVTQQYQGTIYQYNKPAEVLPPSSEADSSTSQTIQSGIAVDTKPTFSQQTNQLSTQEFSQSGVKPGAQNDKSFDSASTTKIRQNGLVPDGIQQTINRFGSQYQSAEDSNVAAPTNIQLDNSASSGNQPTSQLISASLQQNVQESQQQVFKPFGARPQLGSQNTQFHQNIQSFESSKNSQPARGSSQSQFGTSTFGNAAAGQNNGYFYPKSQFTENTPQVGAQSNQNLQNVQNPSANAQFLANQQSSQSQFNLASQPQIETQSTQFGQNSAQFEHKTNSLIPIRQSTAYSQAIVSGQATASASASTAPQYKPFAAQNKNQFGLTQNQVSSGQSAQQFEAQNSEPFGSSKTDDGSLKPYGALNSRSEPATAELPREIFSSACCQASKDSTPSQSADSQTTFQGAQSFNAQAFAGKGEEFGGPRQPPKFDETGYHY